MSRSRMTGLTILMKFYTNKTIFIKWPVRVPASEDAFLLDQKNRALVVDVGRLIIYQGSLGAATVRPVFELWKSPPLVEAKPKPGHSLVELEAGSLVKPKVCSLLSKNILFNAAGLDGLASYQALKSYRKRTLVVDVAQPIEPAAPAAPKNVTTKHKIKEFLRTRNAEPRLLTLEEFLSCLGLEAGFLANAAVNHLGDLVTLSVAEMAAAGIRQDHIVQIKNGISYLMDLHNKSFDIFPPQVAAPNAIAV